MAKRTDIWRHLRRATLDSGLVVVARLERESGEERADAYTDEAAAEKMCENLRTAGITCHVVSRGPIHYIALDDATQPRPNDEALSAFVSKLAEINEVLTTLQQAADDHFGTDPERVNWAHVGDLGWILEQLEEVKEFAARTQKSSTRRSR